ncbi:DMT family transporter [Paenibacillus agri]|uniref:DMT family transporter n=1 Tax=Paenibacillus agri TaxID=2744309 RepID=A0A850EMP5_9BACL|nr:DMT family transporter [Paenibacillus agri]NUU61040.1 DMT family transporter [Paenibacillus agri]
MSSYRSAIVGLIGATLCWGLSYIMSAYLINFFSPAFLSFIRMVLTWLLVLLLLYRAGKLRWPTRQEWLLLTASSLFGTLIQQPLYFSGLKLSSAANGSLIYAVAPLVAIFMERLLYKVSLTAGKLVGGLLGVVGVVIIISFGGGQFSLSLGDLYLVLAMLGMTIGMMFTPLLVKTMPLTAINIISGGLGAILISPMVAIESYNGGLIATNNASIWLMLLPLALITATSGIWWTRGVAVTGPGTASMFMNIPPFISLILGHFLLGDEIYVTQLLGGALILIGVFISNRNASKKVVQVNETTSTTEATT